MLIGPPGIGKSTTGPLLASLLRVGPDPEHSVAVLRERCVRFKRTDWIQDGVDFLELWVRSDQNIALADHVVDAGHRPPIELAQMIADVVCEGRGA